MKRALLSLLLFAAALPAATVFRVDPSPAMTTAGTAPVGGFPALYAVSSVQVTLCADSACASFATSYRDSTGNVACPSQSPVTLPGVTPATCTAYSGTQGQFGFWLPAGLYYYKLTLSSGTVYGPFPLSSNGSSSQFPAGGAQTKFLQILANAGNATTYQWATKPSVVPSDYNYTPIQPGGSLAGGGGSQPITLAVCPLGIYASALWAPVYISGGTGTAEALTPTGGSCATAVGGIDGGTIIVSPANSHSGAWTVQSATAGVQEALIIANTSTMRVYMPGGSYTWYAKVILPGSLALRGAGMVNTNITMASGFTGRAIEVNTGAPVNVDIGDFSLSYTTNGASGEALYLNNISDSKISDLFLQNPYDGITATSAYRVVFQDNNLFPRRNAYNLSNCVVKVFGGWLNMNGVTTGTVFALSGSVENLTINGVSGDGGAQFLTYLGSSGDLTETMVSDTQMDSCAVGCIDISISGTATVTDFRTSNSRAVTTAAASYGALLQSTVAGAISGIDVSNFRMYTLAASQTGWNLQGVTGFSMTGSTVQTGAVGGTGVSLSTTACTDIDLKANKIGIGSVYTPTNGMTLGVWTDGAAHNRVHVLGNTIVGTTTPLTYASSVASSLTARNNPGVDDVIPAVTAATTTVFPVNPSFTLTGTTAVGAVTVPLSIGAQYSFVATNATPGAWTAGATIGNTFTPTQNVPVFCLWDGTKVWCKP